MTGKELIRELEKCDTNTLKLPIVCAGALSATGEITSISVEYADGMGVNIDGDCIYLE